MDKIAGYPSLQDLIGIGYISTNDRVTFGGSQFSTQDVLPPMLNFLADMHPLVPLEDNVHISTSENHTLDCDCLIHS